MKDNIARHYRLEWTLVTGHSFTIISETYFSWGERIRTVRMGNGAGYADISPQDAARLIRGARNDEHMTITRTI